MANVLIVGIDPDEVDFTDPSLPPGMDANKIRHGIATCLADLRTAGHDVRHMYIPADPELLEELANALAADEFDCVVVGGGVRIPPRNLLLFERVVNVAASAPSHPAIALVSRPEEAAAAVARVLARR